MKKKSPFSDLLKNEKLTKDSFLFQFEQIKVTDDIAFLKLEVYDYKKTSIFRFKIQIELDESLKKLKSGDSICKVGLVSMASKNIFQLVKDGLVNAIGDGRIPFVT